MFSDWIVRVRSLFRREAVEQELDDELRFHLEHQVRSYEQAGVDHDEAVRRARLDLGGLEPLKEACRDARGTRWLEDAIQDIRYSARLLKKDRPFTLVVVLVLALGIGLNATVFALVNGALLRDLPFDHPDQVVSLGTRDARRPPIRGPLGYGEVSYREYQEWQQSTGSFAEVGAYADATMNLSDETRGPERFRGAYVSANTFGLLGRQPWLGRDFRPDDDRPGSAPVVILGYEAWTTRYFSDPAIIGQTVRVNAVAAAVIGVMPARFGFPLTAELWQPLAQMPGLSSGSPDDRVLDGVGRLAPGVTIARAQESLDSAAARLARQFPNTDANLKATVWPYAERYIAPQVTVVVVALMVAVLFVLLIACANVANLLLARAARRGHEIAVRLSLGATRGRIVRQLLAESLLLSLIGVASGYVLSIWSVRLLWNVLEASNPPFWLQLTPDGRTFAFLAALCLGTAVVFGLAPTVHASSSHVNDAIHEAPRTATGAPRVRRWASVFVIAEIALTLVLLAGAGFMMQSFFRLYGMRTNVDTSQLVTMRIDLPRLKYRTPAQRTAFVQQLEKGLSRIGPVAAATVTAAFPFDRLPSRALAFDRDAVSNSTRPLRVPVVAIGSAYFDTLGLQVTRGRTFTDADESTGPLAAVVNQRFARLYLPDQDAIGRRIRLTDPDTRDANPTWITIVGVAPTIRRDATVEGDPAVYVPYRADPRASLAVLVRARGEQGGIAPLVREAVRALDPDLPLFDIQTMDERFAFARWPQRVFGTLFVIFACIGLLMAAVGLYAVTSYSVRQRTHEIGVRMAIGAAAPDVWWLILRRTALQLAVGLVLGIPGAIAVGGLPWMGSDHVAVLIAAVLLVTAVTGLAACAPALRAARLDPVRSLRYE